MSAPLRKDEDARCDRCGAFFPLDFGERRLCEECYAACGSCCLEFGADDLWPRDDETSASSHAVDALQLPGDERGKTP